ncbi:oxidoreductase [Gordonia paraffinivorans]|uniref:PDR/VanB family oxidoreductase n=1 Tax=Gordonia paraffinivorans TaxID=175628 RepID=UPI001C931345|nr:PDR/VanB family oxidoreductase [Gordonia paraffinivorans]MBY4575647.1 oxidoreductase [Gordonia paraffinivorans]
MTDTLETRQITPSTEAVDPLLALDPGDDVQILRLTDRRLVAEDVLELTFASLDGSDLPPWEPGAHLDIVLTDGLVRQYSLCGDPDDRKTYRVAVLREAEGRGGSRRIHDELLVGDHVGIQGPRNHFAFHPSKRYLFIAGGIGVTPLIPMIRAAEQAGAEWRLVYGGRSLTSMSYRDELAHWGERVTFWPEDSHGRIDLPSLLGTPIEDTLVYCCGPEPLLDAVQDHCGSWPAGALHVEHFSAADIDDSANTSFEVELTESGMTVEIPADRSILDVVTKDLGIFVSTSCSEGTCGSCETAVVSGEVDHRDVVLTPEEQEANESMMICVSRCKGRKLTLEL